MHPLPQFVMGVLIMQVCHQVYPQWQVVLSIQSYVGPTKHIPKCEYNDTMFIVIDFSNNIVWQTQDKS